MEEKINVAELLKDCPKGLELDCTVYKGIITLDDVTDSKHYPIRVKITYNNEKIIYQTLTKYGQTCETEYHECVIFPKGKNSWQGFQRPFKDGDIVCSTTGNIAILKIIPNNVFYSSYCGLFSNFCKTDTTVAPIRFATKEEKQKLFDAIKANGYKWNEETKILENLIEPIFKKGDKVRVKNGVSEPRIIDNVEDTFYSLVPIGKIDFICQDNWELVPDIKPKFKVGDKIKLKGGDEIANITQVTDYYYRINWKNTNTTNFWPIKKQDDWELVLDIKQKFKVGNKIRLKNNRNITPIIVDITENQYVLTFCDQRYLDFKYQDEWELVPNKFDINALKPFDKVLVRCGNGGRWEPQFFSKYVPNIKFPFKCTYDSWTQCIPYEANIHLCGTCDDCDDFYKIW